MAEIQKPEHSPATREEALIALYKSTFPSVARFVSKRGGSLEQAKDIFQDALVVWYEKSTESGGVPVYSERGYIFGIAKRLWYRRFAEESLSLPLEMDVEDITDQHPSSSRLLNVLEDAGRKCMDLLKSFYYDKLSMAELKVQFGFSSSHSATVQKYKCLEKVRDEVKNKSISYDDFLE